MKKFYCIVGSFFLLAAIYSGCGDIGLNRTIRVADGEKRNGDLNSVNGAILIGKNCEIDGSCRSVNGGIEIGESTTVHDLMAVNGSITISSDAQILGEITTVNGSINCQTGVVVKDEISTVNGNINLDNTRVDYNVLTINGDIFLRNKSVVKGDIVIRARRGFSGNGDQSPLKITISDSSMVQGNVINRDQHRTVTVVLTGGGDVRGQVQKAEIVRE